MSRQNARLKDIRRLRRSKGDEALLEGPHLVEEALNAGCELRSVLVTPRFRASPDGRRLEPRLARPPLEVEPRLLDELADSDSPRGLVAVVHLPRGGADTLPIVEDGVYVYVEGVQDPGNLGALARVAEASGASGLALSPGSVHPHHPRALRASAGSLLRLPAAITVDPDALVRRLAPLKPRWAALVPRGGADLYSTVLEGTLILAVGAEGPGLSDEVRDLAELGLTIPLASGVESLNATVAAAVALFEIRRQRRAAVRLY